MCSVCSLHKFSFVEQVLITRERQAYAITYVYVIQRIKEKNINKSTVKNHTIADNYLEYDLS